MIEYNTRQKPLVLPEYGASIQQMVDLCLEIADRDERTRAAYAIITAMGHLFPEMRQNEASQRKLWDHLAIMAGHRLDIDWPVEPPAPAAPDDAPLKVTYPSRNMRRPAYGRGVEQMAARVAAMPAGPERDELVSLLANQMKKLMLAVNPDGDVDGRVMRDLADYTGGAIEITPALCRLAQFQIVQPATGKKRKRRK